MLSEQGGINEQGGFFLNEPVENLRAGWGKKSEKIKQSRVSRHFNFPNFWGCLFHIFMGNKTKLVLLYMINLSF